MNKHCKKTKSLTPRRRNHTQLREMQDPNKKTYSTDTFREAERRGMRTAGGIRGQNTTASHTGFPAAHTRPTAMRHNGYTRRIRYHKFRFFQPRTGNNVQKSSSAALPGDGTAGKKRRKFGRDRSHFRKRTRKTKRGLPSTYRRNILRGS